MLKKSKEKPKTWIPASHNLFLRQKLPKHYIATFAIFHCHLPFLASLAMANFDVQTSYGGLKVSEFNQEFISKV